MQEIVVHKNMTNEPFVKEFEEAESGLRDQLEQMRIRDPMTTSEFLDLIEEDETAYPDIPRKIVQKR
uniref:Uncharacterized protein n=1 Tax=Hyaloperonospora arabidopsidis (strain Emoy2) TaxID=559515 RepID=M4BZG7_HYAAE